jgi:ribonuclease HI
MELIKMWSDGGCRGNGHEENIGAYAFYLEYWVDNELIHTKIDGGGISNTTNNIEELKGCLEGLKAIKDKSIKVEVYLDSAYVLNGITQWIIGWINNGWKNSKKQDVANKELWIELNNERNKFTNIEFKKVKGHSGEEGNERVDEWLNAIMDEFSIPF